jgi:hypothetical protein
MRYSCHKLKQETPLSRGFLIVRSHSGGVSALDAECLGAIPPTHSAQSRRLEKLLDAAQGGLAEDELEEHACGAHDCREHDDGEIFH